MVRTVMAAAFVGLAAVGVVAARAEAAGSGRLLERAFQKIDTDGDGAISSAEGEAVAEKTFDRRDADGDGVLTRAEFMAETGGLRLGTHRQQLDAFRAKRFAAMDKDGDGKVSAAEFFAAAQQRFTALDANGDGRVTQDEVRSRDSL